MAFSAGFASRKGHFLIDFKEHLFYNVRMGLDGLFAMVVSLLVMLICFVFVFLSGGVS